MCLSLALSSFSTNVTHLLLSQGIGFGIGGCLAYTPTILFMSEWFVKRKGLAFGVVWVSKRYCARCDQHGSKWTLANRSQQAGSGVSGIIFPLAIQWLLGKYGIAATLQISSVTLFILAMPFIYFHRPRLTTTEIAYHRLNFRFLYNKVFIIYQLGNTLEAIGFFLPTIYLPKFARSLGASDFMASLTVTLVNLFQVFGSVLMGFLSDRYHISTCILISTVGTVISVFFIWGFATSIPPLYIFCVAYGLLAGGFSSTWAGVSNEVQKANPCADATVIFPFMETGRGIGNVVSGPLSEALLKGYPWKGRAAGAYGSGYGTLIVCTGASALMGGICVVARQFKWI